LIEIERAWRDQRGYQREEFDFPRRLKFKVKRVDININHRPKNANKFVEMD
jgi:hypothetical protein